MAAVEAGCDVRVSVAGGDREVCTGVGSSSSGGGAGESGTRRLGDKRGRARRGGGRGTDFSRVEDALEGRGVPRSSVRRGFWYRDWHRRKYGVEPEQGGADPIGSDSGWHRFPERFAEAWIGHRARVGVGPLGAVHRLWLAVLVQAVDDEIRGLGQEEPWYWWYGDGCEAICWLLGLEPRELRSLVFTLSGRSLRDPSFRQAYLGDR